MLAQPGSFGILTCGRQLGYVNVSRRSKPWTGLVIHLVLRLRRLPHASSNPNWHSRFPWWIRDERYLCLHPGLGLLSGLSWIDQGQSLSNKL